MPSTRPGSEPPHYRCVVHVMGTVGVLDAWGSHAPAALAAAGAELDRLERLWSRFLGESDVSRLNAAPGEWIGVAPETENLLRDAVRLCGLTGGAFDVTRGGGPDAVDLRPGFARLRPSHRPGSTAGCGQGAVDPAGPAPGSLDLGGVGKGAAVGRIMTLLDDRGVDAALVNLGHSSIGTLRTPPGRDVWRIGITRPPGMSGPDWPVLRIRGGQVSTSGSYEHGLTLDPRTGSPADGGIRSVTVWCDDGTRAEACSTAVLVLGVEAGFALRERLAFDAVAIDAAGIVHTTEGLHDLRPRDPASHARPMSSW